MSDDSFIREVDEELRSERFQEFWSKYGKILIGVAVAIVLGTAGYRYWEHSKSTKSAAAGDSFMAAVRLADEGKTDEAIAAFKSLEGEGGQAYITMARLRSAAEKVVKGDDAGALKEYEIIIADSKANQNMRSIARLRAGMLLVDTGSIADVESKVNPLTAPGAAFRNSAHEALGLANYKTGKLEAAFKHFETIVTDPGVTRAMQQRVRIMLDSIASKGGPVLKN
ncbi:MAG: tetratricopeptide repeat protein [Rhizobiaceae bacterium]